MILTGFFRAQWQNVLSDLLEAVSRMIPAMLSNFGILVRMIGRMFVVFFTWLVTSYQSLFSGSIYEAMVNGFIKIFTWLESKWKDFGTFMGKIWENLFDPAALYEVIAGGMGIDKLATDMADDIATTMENGLVAGLQGVASDELSKMTTGLEGMTPKTDTSILDMINTAYTPLTPPKPPELADAAAYSGPGFGNFGAGGKIGKTADTMAYQSSDYNKKLAEQAARFDFSGKPKSANPQLAAQQNTNVLLQKILNALLTGNPIPLIPAAVGGGSNTP